MRVLGRGGRGLGSRAACAPASRRRVSRSTSRATVARASGTRRRTPTTSILLDIMLPVMNGYQVCRDAAGPRVTGHPILMLTAKDGDWDQIEALDSGADDYVLQAVHASTSSLARLRSLVRRGATERPVSLTRRRPGARPCAADGHPRGDRHRPHGPGVRRCCEFLMRHPGDLVTKQQIIAERVGLRLRRRLERRRGLHRPATTQGRQAVRPRGPSRPCVAAATGSGPRMRSASGGRSSTSRGRPSGSASPSRQPWSRWPPVSSRRSSSSP